MNKKDEKDEKYSEKKMFTDSFGIVDLTNKEAKEEHLQLEKYIKERYENNFDDLFR